MTNVRKRYLLRSGRVDAQDRYERCIPCGRTTDIPLSLSVDLWDCCVEGSGQLCRDCWQRVCGR